MAEGMEEPGSQTPPSFIPAGGTKRRPARSSATPASAQSVHSSEASDGGQIPSFAPSARQRSSSSKAGSAPRTSGTASHDASRAAQHSDAPQSFQPRMRPARRSSGSSRNASAQPAQPQQYAARPHAERHAAHRGAAGSTATPTGRGTAALRRSRRITPLRVVAAVLVVLVLAMVLGVCGLWFWVDGHLNKTDWLTDTANTSGTTWLILGSDERDEDDDSDITGSRTDTILVLTKPRSGSSSLISIPRDSLVSVDDMYMKINAVAELYDNQTLVATVEGITGQKIDHVAQIKFDGLQAVVDSLGGIELCYDSDVSDANSGLEWEAGCHTADGTTALAFARMRYSDSLGDFGRNERQRQVIGAIMDKALSSEILTSPGTLFSAAETTLDAVTVDEDTTPFTVVSMALAFSNATGDDGVSGSVYWTNPDYYVDGVGSSVLLDDERNLELFAALADGSQEAGNVGTLYES